MPTTFNAVENGSEPNESSKKCPMIYAASVPSMPFILDPLNEIMEIADGYREELELYVLYINRYLTSVNKEN